MDPMQFQQLMLVLDQIWSILQRQPHGLNAPGTTQPLSLIAPGGLNLPSNLTTPSMALTTPSMAMAAVAEQHGMVIFFTSGTGSFGGSVTVQLPSGQSNTQGITANATPGSCAYSAWQAAIGVGLQARLESIDGVRIYGVGFSVTVVGATIVKSDF